VIPPELKTSLGIGNPQSAVRLIEFADFQCPFCSVASRTIESALAKEPGRFYVEFHHLPLPGHSSARAASLAAECAADQGKFESLYFALYRDQASIGRTSWVEFAKRAGVEDISTFTKCLVSEQHAQRINQDIQVAARIGVLGTPTWIVADSLYGGAPSTAQLLEWTGIRTTAGKNLGTRTQ
jgi:protein-disulfide isomerase